MATNGDRNLAIDRLTCPEPLFFGPVDHGAHAQEDGLQYNRQSQTMRR